MTVTKKDRGTWVCGDMTVLDDLTINDDVTITGDIVIAGNFTLGEAGAGSDLLIYGDGTGASVLFDTDENLCQFTEYDLQIGTQAVPRTRTSATNDHYTVGVFSHIEEDEDITLTLRSLWARFAVDANVQVGQSAGWGEGIDAIEGNVKLYGGTDGSETQIWCWQIAGVWAMLECDNANGIHFESGSHAAGLFAHIELGQYTEVETGGVAAAVVAFSNSHGSAVIDGDYVGVYVDKESGKKSFADGVKIEDSVADTGIDIGICATAGINIVTGQVTGINIAGTCSTAGISMGALVTGNQAMLVTWSGIAEEATAAAAGIMSIAATSTAKGSASGDMLIGYHAAITTGSVDDQAYNVLIGVNGSVESKHLIESMIGGRFTAILNDATGTIGTGVAAVHAICTVTQAATVSAGPVTGVWSQYNGAAGITTATTSAFFGDMDESTDVGLLLDIASAKICGKGIDIDGAGAITIAINIGACGTGIVFTGTTPSPIDMSSATSTTDITLSNSGTIHNTSSALITIDEAAVTVTGDFTAEGGGITAGKDTSAGTYTLYPGTTGTGITTITMTDNSGDTTTNLNVAGQTGARTYTIPDTLAGTASFVMTEGIQEIDGAKNFIATLGVGKDETAGTLELYPSTSAKGTTTVTMADNDDDTITNLAIAGQTGSRTYTVPDTLASIASFVMTEGIQEIDGAKNFVATLGVGKDETAGTLELYPTTTNKGTTTVTMSDNDDDTITNINVAGQTGSRTYTVPDVLAAASFVMTAGIQEIAGAKNFTSTLGVGKDTSAGTLELFPSTGDRGTTTVTMADNSGDTITNIAVASQTGARTYTIPDADTSAANFVMTAGAQDVGGAKNFTDTLGVGKDTSAGTLELFPSTGDKGTTTVTMSDNDGDTITNINVAGQSGSRTYTVPDIDAGTASFVMTAGAQEIAGAKNFTSTVGIGKDGSAGTLELFPSSSNQGTTTITMADNATDSITNINIAEQAGARTYTVPDAGASAEFLLTDSYKTWWSIALGVVGEDTDGAVTNGGGLAGGTPDITTHDFNNGGGATGDVLCKVYDTSMTADGTWADLATPTGLDAWSNLYQLLPDDNAEKAGDAVAIGFDTQFCEVVFNDLDTASGQLATYGAAAGKWQYCATVSPTGPWTDLTVRDFTDAANPTGEQPFSQTGAITFAPPSDWAQRTLDSEQAYWIQWVVTAEQITQSAIIDTTNKDEPIIAVPNADTFDAPFKATINRIRVTDMGATLHNTAIKFIVGNFTDGVFTNEFTWAASQRTDAFTPTAPLAVDANDLIAVLITDDDGATNNPAFIIELEATYLN